MKKILVQVEYKNLLTIFINFFKFKKRNFTNYLKPSLQILNINSPNKLYIKKLEVTEADIYDIEDSEHKDVSLSYIQMYDNDTSRDRY